MSDQPLLEAPFTLASLPRPYDATTGRSLASPVYGLRGQRWRKRSEVAVAVDGDGVSIYNVRNPRLVTSYALPPQARILCAPYSVYYKPAGQKAQRVTYVAVTNDSTRQTEVVSFIEEALSETSDVSTASQTKATYSLKKKDVYAIYPLASHSDNKDLGAALDVCLVFEDGSVESVSGDLATKRWEADAAQAVALAQGLSSDAFGSVEYATITDVEKARRGLLRSREDALAIIAATDLTADPSALNIPLLVLATVDGSSRYMRVFALPSRSKDLISSTHPGLRHLLSHKLPSIPNTQFATTASDKATFSLHASSGKLQQLLNGQLTTFDFSATVPRILSTLTSRVQPYTSFVRVSPALVMASDPSVCGVYDTKYTSLQGQLLLTSDSVEASPGKRKRIEGEPTALDFVSFYADLGLAVAVSKNSLVGVQVNVSAPAYKKSKSGTSLLINSLGKGFADSSEINAETEAAFTSWKEQVDTLLADGNIDALERFIAAELDISGIAPAKPKSTKSKPSKHDKNYQLPNIDQNKDVKPIEDASEDAQASKRAKTPQSWDLRNVALLVQKTDRRKALYMLTKIFAWTSESAQNKSSITILFFAPNIFKWLALTGYLTAPTITRALSSASPSSTAVESSDIMLALNELDPEMHIMHLLLTLPIHLDLASICVALRTLVKSLDDPKPNLISKLITTGGLDTSSLPAPLALEDEDGALEAAEQDLDYAITQLDSGLSVRSTSLRAIFHRLHAFPSEQIIAALRTHLKQQHLTFFIQLLRVELADGGWTTRYLDLPISSRVHELSEGERPADNSLLIISHLLSCGIDAIGLQGWCVPPTPLKDSVISTLRAETSAALEGAHEAVEMATYLADFERYAAAVREQIKEEKKEARLAGKVDAVKRPGFEETSTIVDPILPMGGKVVKIEKMLARSGGREQKKSKGLLGKEKSMRVGKYSFERIRV